VVRIGIQGSKQACGEALCCGSAVVPSQTVVRTELRATTAPTMPNVIESPPDYASCCFPHASPALTFGAGKRQTAPKDRSKSLISLRKTGAGEGIRTLDPNLGKVGIVQTQVRSPTIAHPGPSDGNRSSRRSLSAKIDALRSNG